MSAYATVMTVLDGLRAEADVTLHLPPLLPPPLSHERTAALVLQRFWGTTRKEALEIRRVIATLRIQKMLRAAVWYRRFKKADPKRDAAATLAEFLNNSLNSSMRRVRARWVHSTGARRVPVPTVYSVYMQPPVGRCELTWRRCAPRIPDARACGLTTPGDTKLPRPGTQGAARVARLRGQQQVSAAQPPPAVR